MHLASATEVPKLTNAAMCLVYGQQASFFYAAVLQLIEQSTYSSQPRLQILKEKQQT
jgi:hypothetical protein